PNYVARYWDMVALADEEPALVIGENGMLRDKPGFEVNFLTRGSAREDMQSHAHPSVLMPVRGHWKVTWTGGEATLAPGDTMSMPEGIDHSVIPSMTGEAALYEVIGTGDPAGLTWTDAA
ncbi:MAG: cupin, partial [Pseudomonadota bacterium]